MNEHKLHKIIKRFRKFTVTFLDSSEFLIHANLNRRDIAKAFQNLC